MIIIPEPVPVDDFSGDKILYLMLSVPEKMHAMNIAVVKNIKKRGCTPVIITVNQPYRVLAKTYAKEGIMPEQYYVIDAVTQYSGGACEPFLHVKYVNNPANLTDLGIAITGMLKTIPVQNKCIMFDSISMLLIHIPSLTAAKFLHFVVNKLKLSDVSGLFLCVDKGLDPVILSQMSASVDRIIDFEMLEKKAGN